MTDPLFWHRLQFGFTITYHYLFLPQLTMGLALLIIVVMKAIALRTGKERLGCRTLLDPHLRSQLRHGRRDRRANGVPVRHQLGRVLAPAPAT